MHRRSAVECITKIYIFVGRNDDKGDGGVIVLASGQGERAHNHPMPSRSAGAERTNERNRETDLS